MKIPLGRILSLLIAIGYVIAIVVEEGGWSPYLVVCLFLLPPLALIWFPDEIGGFYTKGIWSINRINEPTPGIWVSIMGWFFLLGMPFFWYFVLSDR